MIQMLQTHAFMDDGDLLGIQSLGDPVMSTAQSLTELGIRFFLNLFVCWLLVRFFYYPKSRRRDYVFTFLTFSSAMLLLLYAMGRVDVGVGLTLGLFAIFGVIRYRTETVPIREMTYLFIIIALSAVNGLTPLFRVVDPGEVSAHYALGWGDLAVAVTANLLSIALVWALESSRGRKGETSKIILYDRIDLIVPERRAEMLKDIETRCGIVPTDVEIGNIDLLKDSVYIKVYYKTVGDTPSTMGSVFKVFVAAGLLFLPAHGSYAQNVGFNTRTSAEVDWKIMKGLHLNAGYELRTKKSLTGVERHQASIGVEYKVCDWFKVGGEYIFIGHFNSADVFRPRHRLSLNLTGMYDAGPWRFSLKEKLQLTHHAYEMNTFQNVPNALQLKSRFTVKYRGMKVLEPYAYVEMRNIFNAPRFSATYNESTSEWSDYSFLGYGDAYVNRLRAAAGLQWNISRHHGIDFTLMYSRTRSLDIDTNREGTELKSLAWNKANAISLCIGYCFSF